MLVNDLKYRITHRSRSPYGYWLLKCGKTTARKSGTGFPTIPPTEMDLVIDNWKNALLQSRAHFPTYQQPDDDKLFFMK